MTTPITPCLWFDGRAQEAADFYVSVFPDSRVTGVQRVEQDDHPSGLSQGSVLAVSFELEGRPFFALDGGPGHPFTKAVSFQTFPGTQEEFDARWDALVDGGRPLECSWLIDRFGLQWQVVPEPYLTAMRSGDQDVIHAAFSALMVPGKPDFAAVVAAVENVRS